MLDDEIAKLDRLSTLLDSQFQLPGTSLKLGWDTLLGLVPGVGDAASALPSGYLIYKARTLGARKRTVARMCVNTGLDLAVGAIPLLGDIFDLLFKANNRNVALLKKDLSSNLSCEVLV